MKCEVTKEQGVSVLHITGRLDASTAKDFESQIVELIDNNETLLLANCEQLDYISSAGLRVFLLAAKKLSGKGKIYLYSLQEQVNEVFEMSGFSFIFKIFDGQKEALEALTQ